MNIAKRRIARWQSGRPLAHLNDALAVEEPLEIRVDTHPISVTMRTPGHDCELAAGFLLTEGLVKERADITAIRRDPRNQANVVSVFLASHVPLDLSKLTRHVFASSSCGLCGKASIQAVHRQFRPLVAAWKVDRKVLSSLPANLRSGQAGFDQSGGMHAAAVFDLTGRLIVAREDVGRHNAVDKVLGSVFLSGNLPLDRHILMVSGRASFEIVQKALAARIAVVAAISAPSTLAVDFARRSKQTLVGFLRDDRMNIYSGVARVKA